MILSQVIKQRTGVKVATFAGVAAIALAAAAPANATITSVSPDPATDGGVIEVDGTVPTGATAYSLAICNSDITPLGDACSSVAGSFTAIDDHTGNYTDIELTVSRTFANYSFIPPMGLSGGTTTCYDSAEEPTGNGQCSVVASYYYKPGMSYVPFGSPATYDIAVDDAD